MALVRLPNGEIVHAEDVPFEAWILELGNKVQREGDGEPIEPHPKNRKSVVRRLGFGGRP